MSNQVILYGGAFDGQPVDWPDGAQTDVLTGEGGTLWTYTLAADLTTAVLTGVAAAPAPPAPAVPVSVLMWQAKAALAAQPSPTAGQTMLDVTNAAVTAIGGTVAIFWEYATTLARDDPNVASLGATLGLSSAQIDALFIAAAQTTV
jgi:hypothetical protein